MKATHAALLLALAAAAAPAAAHAQVADFVVINEADTNPPGDDSASAIEWVELHNPTSLLVDMAGWQLTSGSASFQIPDASIEPGEFLVYEGVPSWFDDAGAVITLLDEGGTAVDTTPMLADGGDDGMSWQRAYDGAVPGGWEFAAGSRGASNGAPPEAAPKPQEEPQGLHIKLAADKESYEFGEQAKISGSVSERLSAIAPAFRVEQVKVSVSGPGYSEQVNLYPDRDLEFETAIPLHTYLGIAGGDYVVFANYGEALATVNFFVGDKPPEKPAATTSELEFGTDRPEYLPGQIVSLSGFTADTIEFKGLDFRAISPSGLEAARGMLYPTDGKFKTSFFLTTISPEYGTYAVTATYGTNTVTTTFEVVEDLRDDAPVSLAAERAAYGLGETVSITGRLNEKWVSTLDLEIVQTTNTAAASATGSYTGFRILDHVGVQGDGRFAYEFAIPQNQIRYGDYKITVSSDAGTASTIIHAVEDPENYAVADVPLTITTDKATYEIGDTIRAEGRLRDLPENLGPAASSVKVLLHREDGTQIDIISDPLTGTAPGGAGFAVDYAFNAVLETSGRYAINIDVSRNLFPGGKYTLTATYDDYRSASSFEVLPPHGILGEAVLSLDKEVYGLGEQVTLSGMLTTTAAPSVSIVITNPDGTTSRHGATLEDQRFAWSWTTPISEKTHGANVGAGSRSLGASNFGVYKVTVSTDSFSEDLRFKVSADPGNDSLATLPITVSTSKPLYMPGERLEVSGHVTLADQGREGLVVPKRVAISVIESAFPYRQLHDASVHPGQGGGYSSTFVLPPTVFRNGEYIVRAEYVREFVTTTFRVANSFALDRPAELALVLQSDKPVYYPGDSVTLTGKPTKIVHTEKFDLRIVKEAPSKQTCTPSYCGERAIDDAVIRPESDSSFTFVLELPDSDSALGLYEAVAEAEFDSDSALFEVVPRPEVAAPETVIERQNRIPERAITIPAAQKETDFGAIAPRVVSGSLVVPRADPATVDLRVTTPAGTCIIGPGDGCLVGDSTRGPGKVYDTVEADGLSLNVRYSGPGATVEKFSILPSAQGEFLPDSDWNVEVLKSDEVSRFYYKVTYKQAGASSK